jgi:hypothetical protein
LGEDKIMGKVCDCEKNMADKIVDYCQREIESKEQMKISVAEKKYKDIEQAGIDTLKRVINKISYLSDRNYKFTKGDK